MSDPYVYILIDPRDGLPFYVGKGSKGRAKQHEKDVRRGSSHNKNRAKTAVIQEIIDSGLTVQIKIASYHADDISALKAEIALIKEIGLENLTNIMSGGQPGGRMTAEQAEYSKWKKALIPATEALLDYRVATVLAIKTGKLRWFVNIVKSIALIHKRACAHLGEEESRRIMQEYLIRRREMIANASP